MKKRSKLTHHSLDLTHVDFERELQLVPQVGLLWRQVFQPLLEEASGPQAPCQIVIGIFQTLEINTWAGF